VEDDDDDALKGLPQSLTSGSSLQVWWAKVNEYEYLCVPTMVELGSFILKFKLDLT